MIEYVLFVVGILLLIKSADFLVDGSAILAKKLGISTFVIGLTIVAFGTSLPELIVNIFAATEGVPEVAFGNIIGSSISNILLIMGIAAVLFPLQIGSSAVWREIPFALLAAVVLFVVANDALIDHVSIFSLTRIDGLVLLLFFVIFIYYVFETAKSSRTQVEDEKAVIHKHKNSVVVIMILLGLIGLYLGGKWTVEGAVFMATQFGLSQFLISATIIAIGTSLPELAATFVAIKKKDADLGVGNLIGSNVFNIFWILGVTAMIAPVPIPDLINFDMVFLIGATTLLFFFMFIGRQYQIERWQGLVLLLLYMGYLAAIILRG